MHCICTRAQCHYCSQLAIAIAVPALPLCRNTQYLMHQYTRLVSLFFMAIIIVIIFLVVYILILPLLDGIILLMQCEALLYYILRIFYMNNVNQFQKQRHKLLRIQYVLQCPEQGPTPGKNQPTGIQIKV